ncbi:hypothetical protein RHSIM_Rhsim02G0018600 [Rhododendron simsii]|uniref:ARM repeat superfamily protein n=1 Tax=Rhododendron simsii TaxID=118357 RepID=A0A834LW08_RHOSS|nr:hypothetical protein RHSIM_Rhsim02G0018600 [Rhododendron simsii]
MDHGHRQVGRGRGYSVINISSFDHSNHGPEKELTLVVLRLAALEKAATGFGTLGFVWATAVLLGGFASTLGKTDFWFISLILLIEGARIFSRSHEIEWQQREAKFSICSGPINVVRKQSRRLKRSFAFRRREWEISDVPILTLSQWVFLPSFVRKVLSGLQLAFAAACAVLSLMKLIERDFGEVAKGDPDKTSPKGGTDKMNREAALIIFYSLALAEALLFLLEKAYWGWEVTHRKVLEEAHEACGLGSLGMDSTRRFFYEAYSRSIYGSVFNGLKMDMVSHAMGLLDSKLPDEQLIGIRILQKFATNERFSDHTFQKIGTKLPVMERLVEMLNWKGPEEEEIRQSAAEILSNLTSQKQHALRVLGIPGAMESISSLVQNRYRMSHGVVDGIPEKIIIHYNERFNYFGILILKNLAQDHDDCGKIGNTRGLLPKIIDFTHVGERLLKDDNVEPSQIEMVKLSLQVLKMLASMTGTAGKQLRNEISEIIFTISNIRDILKYGEKQTELQKLGIEILTSLAMEADARERIGGTGGVLKELFNIFFKEGLPENQNDLRIVAGEALAMLAFESKRNCRRFLNLNVIEMLVEALELEVPFLRINAARILKNLCIYAGADCFTQLRGVINAAPVVLGAIMTEEGKLQEVMVGLAVDVFKFMTSAESSILFRRAGTQELAKALVQILRKYKNPANKTPGLRRFVIELGIWLMNYKEKNVKNFKDLGMIEELESVLETTSDLENFNSFFGVVGMSRHSTTIHSLVETAMKLMEDKQFIRQGKNKNRKKY